MDRPSASNGVHPCQAMRKDGRPCSVRPLPGSHFCFAHDPAKATARELGRRKGGAGKARIARAGKLVPASLKPTLALLFDALTEVHDGSLSPGQAAAMAALAGAITRLYAAGVLEERLAALEERSA